jgi:flagellar biogenesis protein FliO
MRVVFWIAEVIDTIPADAREVLGGQMESLRWDGWPMLGVRMGVLLLFVLGLGWALERFGGPRSPLC